MQTHNTLEDPRPAVVSQPECRESTSQLPRQLSDHSGGPPWVEIRPSRNIFHRSTRGLTIDCVRIGTHVLASGRQSVESIAGPRSTDRIDSIVVDSGRQGPEVVDSGRQRLLSELLLNSRRATALKLRDSSHDIIFDRVHSKGHRIEFLTK